MCYMHGQMDCHQHQVSSILLSGYNPLTPVPQSTEHLHRASDNWQWNQHECSGPRMGSSGQHWTALQDEWIGKQSCQVQHPILQWQNCHWSGNTKSTTLYAQSSVPQEQHSWLLSTGQACEFGMWVYDIWHPLQTWRSTTHCWSRQTWKLLQLWSWCHRWTPNPGHTLSYAGWTQVTTYSVAHILRSLGSWLLSSDRRTCPTPYLWNIWRHNQSSHHDQTWGDKTCLENWSHQRL